MDELVKTVDTLQGMLSKVNDDEFMAIRTALDAVLQVKAFEEADRWIPCDEILPEIYYDETETYMTSECVLVTGNRDGCGDPPVLIGFYEDDLDGRTYWETVDGEMLFDVTAWQPLPKPYGGAK